MKSSRGFPRSGCFFSLTELARERNEEHLFAWNKRSGRECLADTSRLSNARRSRFSCRLGSARASRTNFVAARRDASAPTTVENGTRTTPATLRRDKIALDNPPAAPVWVSEAPLRGTDRSGGGAADRSSVGGAVARANSRTR